MTSFDRLSNWLTKPWIVFSYLGLIIVSFLYLDKPIAYYFHHLDFNINSLSHVHQFFYIMSKTGVSLFYIIALFFLAVFFRYVYHHKKQEMRTWFLWLCVLIPNLICLALKMLIGRARPERLFDEHLYGFYGWHTHSSFWSFPSGHTTTIMSLVFGLCVLFPRYCYALILLGVMLVSTRVFLTSHYLSDVLATSYLTLLEIKGLLWYLQRKTQLMGLIVLDK